MTLPGFSLIIGTAACGFWKWLAMANGFLGWIKGIRDLRPVLTESAGDLEVLFPREIPWRGQLICPDFQHFCVAGVYFRVE